MKAGLSTSLVLHAALIAFGLVTLSAPPAHDVGDVQAVPVDLIPMEELTQLQQGDKTAQKAEKPAPKQTERPHTVPDAKTIGNNDIDLLLGASLVSVAVVLTTQLISDLGYAYLNPRIRVQ